MKRKNFRLKKRGSLNLSIEAIVIVVIAFTVLGLGLAFVKSQLGGIGKTSSDVQSRIKDQILEDMRTSGKKLSVTQEVQLERGKEAMENIGVVNTDTITHKFGITAEVIKPSSATATIEDITFFYDTTIGTELSPTSGNVIPMTISAASGANGNYLCKITVYSCTKSIGESAPCTLAESQVYDTRSFFVKVG